MFTKNNKMKKTIPLRAASDYATKAAEVVSVCCELASLSREDLITYVQVICHNAYLQGRLDELAQWK